LNALLSNASGYYEATMRAVFGARAGQRWVFRRNRGWLGGDRITDHFVLWLCFAFAFMGVALLVKAHSGVIQTTGSKLWPAAAAKIVSLDVEERISGHSREWTPHVIYRYSVSGRQYQGSRVAMTQPRWTSREEVDAFLARYVVRSTVMAYYDPDEPGQAVLERHVAFTDGNTITGVLLIVIAACALGIYVRVH
jgi:hypothetical protein